MGGIPVSASSAPVRPESPEENLSLFARIFQAIGNTERAAAYPARLDEAQAPSTDAP